MNLPAMPRSGFGGTSQQAWKVVGAERLPAIATSLGKLAPPQSRVRAMLLTAGNFDYRPVGAR
ncbi:MAG: hypothetical protein HOQ05_03705 [Corynebacteriales bacterium]|nr:hypothetical protein [Mycobacteriales bacterium]